jgi:GIY-YIG catalytic domain
VVIGFNTFLSNEGIDPTEVKLVRHQDTRFPGRPSPYQLLVAGEGQFDLYQRIQSRPVFKGARLLASFVATPLDETLFTGLYDIIGVGRAATGLIDPISGEDVGGKHYYDLVLSPKLAEYRRRLVIEWGPGYRNFVHLARNHDKTVLEVRRAFEDPPFPGFLDFCGRLERLAEVPTSWRIALSSVNGVYLLINPDTGAQYVGSAQGSAGFWGRWQEYASSGHGGNRRMKDIPRADYQISILEVASSSAGHEAVLKMETRWKQKLLSRKFGLNANG